MYDGWLNVREKEKIQILMTVRQQQQKCCTAVAMQMSYSYPNLLETILQQTDRPYAGKQSSGRVPKKRENDKMETKSANALEQDLLFHYWGCG